MSGARFLALVAAAAGLVALPSLGAAQNVVIVPAAGAYDAYGQPSQQPGQPRYAGLAPFIEALSPYGTWVDLPTVGLAWKPNDSMVGATFVPYLTNGHWLYSDVGWSFESDFEWGYATFHYGRWLYDGQWGWVWSPDTEWGAAWVDWRVAEGYVGWAPLAPDGYAYAAGYGPSYTFVSVSYLAYADLVTYILPAPATTYWAQRSAPCTTMWSGGGRTWPAGPQIAGPSAGVVRVNPPARGVVQVRPPAGDRRSSDRGAVRPGAFVDASARVGVSGPPLPPPAWGTNRPAMPPPSAPSPPPPGARPSFGVQRTVLPPRYDAPPPPAQPQFAQPAQPQFAPPAQPHVAQPAPPQFARPAQPQFAPPAQPHVAQPAQPRFAPPVAPERPTFAPPAAPAQPPPQRPTFTQPAQPQRPAFAPPERPGLVQPRPPVQPPPQAPVVARPPPAIVVPPSAVRGGAFRARPR